MKIIDINGKERNIQDDIKIISHKVNSTCIEVKNKSVGKKKNVVTEKIEKFVEVVILGKRSNWIEWYPLKEFEKLNLGIELNYGIDN